MPGRQRSTPDAGRPPERLQKVLARTGFGSRRAAEDLIRQGRVTVDGREATLGDRVDAARAAIEVDGAAIPSDPDLRYFALHKPAGVTTTMRDPHAERTLAGLLPAGPRVFPVGRLDRETEGLLLLTNDGELANRLLHPRFGVEKEYLAEVDGALSREAVARLRGGVDLDDGVAKAVSTGPIQMSRGRSSISIVMTQGRKREVRRMFAAVGFPVRRLVRVRVGPVLLDQPPSTARPLHPAEVIALYRVTALHRARPGRP